MSWFVLLLDKQSVSICFYCWIITTKSCKDAEVQRDNYHTAVETWYAWPTTKPVQKERKKSRHFLLFSHLALSGQSAVLPPKLNQQNDEQDILTDGKSKYSPQSRKK
jgi:Gpi18-like mannosyltransferase